MHAYRLIRLMGAQWWVLAARLHDGSEIDLLKVRAGGETLAGVVTLGILKLNSPQPLRLLTIPTSGLSLVEAPHLIGCHRKKALQAHGNGWVCGRTSRTPSG